MTHSAENDAPRTAAEWAIPDLTEEEGEAFMDALTAENDAAAIARLITASIAGRRWRDMTPLDVARYLVAHDVRVIPPAKCPECGGSQVIEVGLPDVYRACPTCVIPPGGTHDE